QELPGNVPDPVAFAEAIESAIRAQADAQPVAWVRYCSDGTFEGPIMDTDIRMAGARRTSGAWTPLYTHPAEASFPAPAAQQQAEPGADERAAFEAWQAAELPSHHRNDYSASDMEFNCHEAALAAWLERGKRVAQAGRPAGERECRHCGWMCRPNDAPSKAWHPLEQEGQRAGVDAVEIMRICRLFLDGKEGDYDAKACFTAIFKIAAAAPTQQHPG
uniref:hypothetical protein n=1 Tax=Klebsiella pneumoniae TaxID=573 RepID=UPI001E64057F